MYERHALSEEAVHSLYWRGQFWLWPSKLTLQAPAVAVLWQLLLARCLHVAIDPFAPFALALAVWLIYVADHLIDTARPLDGTFLEPPRKAFCRRHRGKFLGAAVIVTGVLAVIAVSFLRAETVRMGWRVLLAVACYFALIHALPAKWRQAWPRELAVAVIFTLGVFGAVALTSWAPGLMLTALCFVNCCVIESWEGEANATARWVARYLVLMGMVVLVGSFALPLPVPFALATGVSGLGLIGLAYSRARIQLPFVSPAADLVLCSPLLVVLWPA